LLFAVTLYWLATWLLLPGDPEKSVLRPANLPNASAGYWQSLVNWFRHIFL
jgi:hypothetical protein